METITWKSRERYPRNLLKEVQWFLNRGKSETAAFNALLPVSTRRLWSTYLTQSPLNDQDMENVTLLMDFLWFSRLYGVLGRIWWPGEIQWVSQQQQIWYPLHECHDRKVRGNPLQASAPRRSHVTQPPHLYCLFYDLLGTLTTLRSPWFASRTHAILRHRECSVPEWSERRETCSEQLSGRFQTRAEWRRHHYRNCFWWAEKLSNTARQTRMLSPRHFPQQWR